MRLLESVRDLMVEHFSNCSPEEGCGLLFGTPEELTEFVPVTNVDHSPKHFTLDPLGQLQAQKKARRAGKTYVVLAHSHPIGPDRLSSEDVGRASMDPSVPWLLVSSLSDGPKIQLFAVDQDGPKTLELEVVRQSA